MSGWAEVYWRLEDSALAQLASPGLVRRAAKFAPAAVLPEGLEGDKQWSGRSGQVQVGEYTVSLDAGGPARASCPCPAAGICVHVVAAALAIRAAAPRRERGSESG
ncbi:MAG: SWIM zinc finger family protein, partial [Bifidobacteriaceae bacterium]|nr:SWIM zinc finger family protein [Bifidobacteriaceae bacterium]